MAGRQKKNRGFALFIALMVLLLILAIMLFVYGSMNNGIPQPKLPGKGVFALGTIMHHG